MVHAPSSTLEPDAVGTTRWIALEGTPAGEIGIWEMDPGTAQDVETDEAFVVLTGGATISVEGWPDVVVGPAVTPCAYRAGR